MNIDRAGCEWYKLDIKTEPATTPTQWEASFAGGQYVRAKEIEGLLDDVAKPCSAWLVAGPDYTGGASPDYVAPLGSTAVKVRLVDDPEVVVRKAEIIRVHF